MPTVSHRGLRGSSCAAIVPVVVLGSLLVASPGPVHAQTAPAPAGTEGASGAHLLVGGFIARFDVDGGGRTDLFGGRAGLGIRELVQLTGFYWRGFDRSADSITAEHAWGGELQLNLNAGFGLAPFVTGGLARVHQGSRADQTAAIAGAGLTFPLGPVLLEAGVRDYMFGVTGLEGADSPENVTHNWLYGAGLKLALGSRRRTRPVAAARPGEADDRALRAASAELAALRAETAALAAQRDSLLAADPGPAPRRAPAGADSVELPRNYQSERRIEVPIPTEGSITLRYGPEAATTAPIVITAPGAAAGDSRPAATADGSPATAAPPAAAAGASLDDPAVQAWLRQVVAAQVADQLARRPAAAPALTEAQVDALAQRVLDGVVATVVRQLDAAQTRRLDALREDLRSALRAQREEVLAEIARTREAAPQQVAAASATAAEPAAEPAAESAARTRADAAIGASRAEAAQRDALAAAAAHPRFLSAAETHRGPAVVLGDAAFQSDAALVVDAARPAVAAVAELLRAYPDRRIYIHGHTDGAGTELRNQRLSELHAEAVRSLLVQEGVETDRLFAVGYGHARAAADNTTARGRALMNRRVEIVIGESRSIAAR